MCVRRLQKSCIRSVKRSSRHGPKRLETVRLKIMSLPLREIRGLAISQDLDIEYIAKLNVRIWQIIACHD